MSRMELIFFYCDLTARNSDVSFTVPGQIQTQTHQGATPVRLLAFESTKRRHAHKESLLLTHICIQNICDPNLIGMDGVRRSSTSSILFLQSIRAQHQTITYSIHFGLYRRMLLLYLCITLVAIAYKLQDSRRWTSAQNTLERLNKTARKIKSNNLYYSMCRWWTYVYQMTNVGHRVLCRVATMVKLPQLILACAADYFECGRGAHIWFVYKHILALL